MRLRLLRKFAPAILLAASCVAVPENESREKVARVLTHALGDEADPDVGFRQSNSHLQVNLLTVAFPTVSDAELTGQAKRIAKTSLSNYDRGDQLDSVTVVYREKFRRGMWWIRHSRTFHVDSLKDVQRLDRPQTDR